MRTLADDAHELISTIWTDVEYRAMIEEQHWQLMRKRYQSKPEPLPTDVTIGYDGRCDDEDDTEDVGPVAIVWPMAIALGTMVMVVAFLIVGGR